MLEELGPDGDRAGDGGADGEAGGAESDEPMLPNLVMPAHHDIRPKDVMLRRLHGTLAAAADQGPKDFTELLMLPGVGARTVKSLAQVAEVIHGAPYRFADPARFAMAHGGKDGHPFPVPLKVYDETIKRAEIRGGQGAARLDRGAGGDQAARRAGAGAGADRDGPVAAGVHRRGAAAGAGVWRAHGVRRRPRRARAEGCVAERGLAFNVLPRMADDDLHFGPLGEGVIHICVDMQRMFEEETEWHLPWMTRVLPVIVDALRGACGADGVYAVHSGARAGSRARDVAALL